MFHLLTILDCAGVQDIGTELGQTLMSLDLCEEVRDVFLLFINVDVLLLLPRGGRLLDVASTGLLSQRGPRSIHSRCRD